MHGHMNVKKVASQRRLTCKRKNGNNTFFSARIIFGEVNNFLAN
jgi:hypothetical protein